MIIEPDAYRKFTRIQLDGHVNLEFISENYDQCKIHDVSLAGMFIKGDFQHDEISKYCNLSLVSTGMPQDLILQGLAKIVRKNDEGIAIEFTSMLLESYILLLTILLNQTENPLLNNKILAEICPFEVTDDFPIASVSNNSFH